MAANGVALSSTLTVLRSWWTFGSTTRLPRFFGDESQTRIRDRYEQAKVSVMEAHRAGVLIAAGTDFGGGSSRANQLAWEVESLVEAGLEPWEALAAATWHGGEILGEPEAGTIREGGPGRLLPGARRPAHRARRALARVARGLGIAREGSQPQPPLGCWHASEFARVRVRMAR